MTVGLAVLGALPASTPVGIMSALMILVGLCGPLVMPPATAVLLDSVPEHRTGTASGVFNTSRQLGGALAVAVFGALLAIPSTFLRGVHASLLIAAAVVAAATVCSLRLHPRTATKES
jgi:sugar phosphate permease